MALKSVTVNMATLLFNTIPAFISLVTRRALTTTLAGPYITSDVVLQLLILVLLVMSAGTTGGFIISNTKIPWQYSPWYIAQWALTGATWIFGYIGQHSRIYLPHLLFAIIRSAFCLVSLAGYVHYRLYRRLRMGYTPTFILLLITVAALCHVKLAYDRMQEHRKLQAKVFVNPSNYRVNKMTGNTMRYYSGAITRNRNRDQATEYMTKASDKNQFWYHPLVMVEEQNPSTVLGESYSASTDLGTPHFSPCYCCLDSDQPTRVSPSQRPMSSYEEGTAALEVESRWAEQRERFLQQPSQDHPSFIPPPFDADGIGRLGKEFIPHYLCEKCTFMAANSFLIQLLSGWTFSTYRKFISRAFKRESSLEETFEHWSTPSGMQSQVDIGCHLCTMVWHTMSEEQQKELLSYDSMLEQEMHQLLSDTNYAGDEIEKIKTFYHRRRCIRMRIRSPLAHKAWAHSWKSRHSGQSLRLIPHFGGNQVVRRWMKQKLAYRAISLNEDPVLDWDQEQDDGLEIASMALDNKGPIVVPISHSTGSDSTMEFIKSWLYGNERFRDPPQQAPEGIWNPVQTDIALEPLLGDSGRRAPGFRLPNRLIDVGSLDDPTVRLCPTTDIRKDEWSHERHSESLDAHYVALSHSWGTIELLSLTESTLRDFSLGIPMKSLPPTFRDAVSVVRRVGLRFLWIDSLCIIQDSEEDWRREAAQMKDVYTNAEFVIAAIASWTSSDSFFVHQFPLAANPCLLGVRGHLFDLTNNSPKSFSGIYALPPLKYTRKCQADVHLSRLRSRAWCYQEEHLARKIVYFGDHQVLLSELKSSGDVVRSMRQVDWTSKIDNRAGTFPDLIHPPLFQATKAILRQEIPSLPIFRLLMNWTRRLLLGPLHRVANANWRETEPAYYSGFDEEFDSAVSLLTSQWWRVVKEFSDLYLTKEEDKLQALSGIALRYQSQAIVQGLNVDYFAGLWGDGDTYLATGLLWYISRYSAGREVDEYRAPSWSWASVDGLVKNDSLYGCCSADHTGIRILQCSVEGPGVVTGSQASFPTGKCNAGYILVRGHLQKASWDVLQEGKKRYYVEQPGKHNYIYNAGDLDQLAPWSSDPFSGPEAYALFSESGVRVGYFLPDVKGGSPGEIHCLRIVVKPERKAEQEDFSVPWATRGLALVSTDLEANEYRRVGYFELDKTPGGLSFPHSFSKYQRRAIRWPAPEIDVANFFDGSSEHNIVIR